MPRAVRMTGHAPGRGVFVTIMFCCWCCAAELLVPYDRSAVNLGLILWCGLLVVEFLNRPDRHPEQIASVARGRAHHVLLQGGPHMHHAYCPPSMSPHARRVGMLVPAACRGAIRALLACPPLRSSCLHARACCLQGRHPQHPAQGPAAAAVAAQLGVRGTADLAPLLLATHATAVPALCCHGSCGGECCYHGMA